MFQEKMRNLHDDNEARSLLKRIIELDSRQFYHAFCKPLPELEFASTYCVCGFCRDDMREKHPSKKFCCGEIPCVTTSSHFRAFCLNSSVIQSSMPQYAFYHAEREVEYKSSKFRNTAFRHFVLWKFGKLGKYIRQCPPTCVRVAIRYKFPSINGEYNGFEATPK